MHLGTHAQQHFMHCMTLMHVKLCTHICKKVQTKTNGSGAPELRSR